MALILVYTRKGAKAYMADIQEPQKALDVFHSLAFKHNLGIYCVFLNNRELLQKSSVYTKWAVQELNKESTVIIIERHWSWRPEVVGETV
jgi:hypothetical protein